MTARRDGRPATAYDVARLAGVSQSAVSRAFTPKASISEETKARIVEAANALNYRPNVIARSLITRRSRVIGLVAAYLQNQFYPDVLEALSAQLKERGYHVLLFTADRDRPAEPLLDEIIGYRVDGVILASATLSSHLAEECRAAGIPVLLFNRTATAADGVSSVTGENERGGRLVARFLAAGAHRRIAYMAGIENASTSRDREAGLRRGLAQCSLFLHRRAVGEYRFDKAAAATRALLSDPDPPDAVFCANDHMALAALEVARHEFKLTVPQDLSVVGFDDVGPAGWPSFSLTSFSQPIDGMVGRAVELITSLVEEPSREPRHAVVPGELVVRGSARRPTGCVDLGGRIVWRDGEVA